MLSWRASRSERASAVVDRSQLAAVSGDGHYRVPSDGESELVYVVLTEKGQETLEPKEFASKYRVANSPTRVRLGN